MDGRIVVDGILASSYAFLGHDLARVGMIPIRLFPQLMEFLFGDDIVSPVFVNVIKHMGELILPFSLN